ncbi:hypothetical protein BHE74_00007734, partial [Ensete ventricosum]
CVSGSQAARYPPPPADESSSCGCPPSGDPNHSLILTQRRIYPSKDFSAAGILLSATSRRARVGTQLMPPYSFACIAPPPILCPPFIYKARLFLWPHLLLQIRRWTKSTLSLSLSLSMGTHTLLHRQKRNSFGTPQVCVWF